VTDSSDRRRFPIWATVVIYLVVLVTAITASGYLFYLGVYGTTEGCFDAVTEIAEEIQVAEAGTVESSTTYDGGGLRNCADPRMSVQLSGVNAATNIERNLAAAGFTRAFSDSGIWSRPGVQIDVDPVSPGITKVLIRTRRDI
jgi:hypothetical protein